MIQIFNWGWMTINRFVLLVSVKVFKKWLFCYDQAVFPDMNYEKLDQILWRRQKIIMQRQILAEICIRGDWNYQIGIWISMVYTKEACVEKKKVPWNPTEPQIPHMLYFHFLVKPRSCSFLMYTQGINNFDTVNVKKN